ncbi:type 4 prepilin-like proteins leader peptide-processing enzyme [Thiosulfatimonas sediminis]|uniref:Prepilin leader peptidase/N-methyltransferase n=1 Tax=Thiosulfatimonas sediminis TaxID=2675054 RepID=A0A6F8PUM5_9GAMM|nr:A24 family peptidase [Thiosulfatimonas sediminis]BBP45708.1 type 4 prepilin-like proteins leader peptide-processing enzyme [Thiosulfatimonas sediminis]
MPAEFSTPLLTLPPILSALFGIILGLIIGSFLSMLTWRMPLSLFAEDENTAHYRIISTGRSRCPNCHTELPWYRLIPLFSWLYSKGKCHHCHTPISKRYPLIELASAILTATTLLYFGFSLEGFAALIFCWLLIAITVIDIEHQLILDNLSFPLLWIGLLLNTQSMFTTLELAVWGAALGYLLLWSVFHSFRLLTGKEGMGYGDFKMLAALGAWFGALAIAQIIFIAALSSILIGLSLALLKIRPHDAPFAFGPYLALGGLVTLFFGSEIL